MGWKLQIIDEFLNCRLCYITNQTQNAIPKRLERKYEKDSFQTSRQFNHTSSNQSEILRHVQRQIWI